MWHRHRYPATEGSSVAPKMLGPATVPESLRRLDGRLGEPVVVRKLERFAGEFQAA